MAKLRNPPFPRVPFSTGKKYHSSTQEHSTHTELESDIPAVAMEKHSASTAKSNGGGPKSGGGGGGGGRGKKKAIRVVYISNPMRVQTSAAGFRALVQELTGRHADPSKYAAAAAASSASASPDDAPPPQPGPGLAAGGGGGAAFDDDGFVPQMLDNSYGVFSPPSMLYDAHYNV